IHEQVELRNLGKSPCDLAFFGNVAFKRPCSVAEFAGKFLGGFQVQVQDDDSGSVESKVAGGGFADASGSAGDECGFANESKGCVHEELPILPCSRGYNGNGKAAAIAIATGEQEPCNSRYPPTFRH